LNSGACAVEYCDLASGLASRLGTGHELSQFGSAGEAIFPGVAVVEDILDRLPASDGNAAEDKGVS